MYTQIRLSFVLRSHENSTSAFMEILPTWSEIPKSDVERFVASLHSLTENNLCKPE